jgi:uncharacterized protein involved in exopolysaccharide biosynthesis
MSLVWTVPVMAAAVATGLVAARARALEDATRELAREVGRLRSLRPRLAAVRSALTDTEVRAAEFRRRHPVDSDDDAGQA